MPRLPFLSLLVLSACAGAGPYGFSPEYVPSSGEEAALANVTEVGYEDVRRDPNGYAVSQSAPEQGARSLRAFSSAPKTCAEKTASGTTRSCESSANRL